MRSDELDEQSRLGILYQEFIQRDGFNYQIFRDANALTIEEVKEALVIYVRREIFAEYWSRQERRITLDEWFDIRKKDLNIFYPPRQDMDGGQGGRSNKAGRKPPGW